MDKNKAKIDSPLIAEFRRKDHVANLGGGEERLKSQKERGKLNARQRIAHLLDVGTFQETGKFVTHHSTSFDLADQKYLGDGVVTGFGKINSRPVAIFSQDFTVLGGSLSYSNAQKIVKIMEHAERLGCPVIGLNDSGGARIQEGVESLAGYAEIFQKNVDLSGMVPQLSAVLGPCAGGAVYSPALTDFIFMVEGTSHMFITGPDVIKTVTKEDVDKEELGGAHTHSHKSGVCHLSSESEQECFSQIRSILNYLPSSFDKECPRILSGDPPWREESSLNSIIPQESNEPYDMKSILNLVLDKESFFEVQSAYAPNIIIGFARLNGYSLGIIANQPQHLAGCLDIQASQKAARFVRTCDAFGIPLLTFVDVPGFLPGTKQEWGGIISHGAKLLYAYAEASVPKMTVITRKAYGGAYDVMSSKHLRGDFNIAFPSAEIAVMGPEGAVSIIFRKQIKEGISAEKLSEEYRDQFANPWHAASLGYIDAVIEPAHTRRVLSDALEILKDKSISIPRKKHGNIPL